VPSWCQRQRKQWKERTADGLIVCGKFVPCLGDRSPSWRLQSPSQSEILAQFDTITPTARKTIRRETAAWTKVAEVGRSRYVVGASHLLSCLVYRFLPDLTLTSTDMPRKSVAAPFQVPEIVMA
jgi:hypothetical protein